MTKLLLHVGHPKTGTTALQSVLSANAKTLLEKGSVLYPTRTKPQKIKHALAIPWLLGLEYEAVRRAANASDEKLLKISENYWRSITNEIETTKASNTILSAEGLWILRKASASQQANFRQSIEALSTDVSVAGYLKSPAPHFASMINQKLRNFREVTLPSPRFYRESIEAWESLRFNNYSWRIFDRNCLDNGDIIDDFCQQHLPDTISINDLNREGVEDANSSVSNEALVILEELAELHPDLKQNIHDQRRRIIVEILKEIDKQIGGNHRPSLTETATTAMISRCKDLAWLQDRGLSFPDINPDLIGAAGGPWPESFTRVSDFCPINTERLSSMRSASQPRIKKLFTSPTNRFFWPFRRREKNTYKIDQDE
jgi:hypothetical protein